MRKKIEQPFTGLGVEAVNDDFIIITFDLLIDHFAAGQAVRDRFRAIFLTSVTTIAGMLPLLSETSLQAQVLVPLVASVVFGMMSSTVLLLLVLPASYAIMEDLGIRETEDGELTTEKASAS